MMFASKYLGVKYFVMTKYSLKTKYDHFGGECIYYFILLWYYTTLIKEKNMSKKVLLISPPFERLMGYRRFYYPVGLVSLAAVLEEQGHSVDVYDMDHDANAISMTPEELMDNYNNYSKSLNDDNHYIWKELDCVINCSKPDFIGISVFSSALSISKK